MSFLVTRLIGFGARRSGACGCVPAYVTGNRTAQITVTTTLAVSSGAPSQLVDGSIGGGFNPTHLQAVAGLYLKFDFLTGASKKITEAKYYVGGTSTHGTWQWAGSNDDSAWTDIGSSFTLGGTTGGQALTQLAANAVGYRYYRMMGVSGNYNAASGSDMFEFEFKECNC